MERRPCSPRSTRRAALAGSLGLSLTWVAGCSAAEPPAEPRGRTSTSSAPSGPQGPDPEGVDAPSDDQVLLERTVREIVAVAALVTATARSTPSLRQDLAPLVRLHRAHATVLSQSLERQTSGRRRPGRASGPSPDKALGAVLDREQALRRRLVDGSVAADSGALARVLASMSAGLSQHLAVLATAGPR